MTHPFEYLSQSCAANPDGVAISSIRRDITYRELLNNAVRFARIFRAQGLKPGSVVAIRCAPLHYSVIVQALFHEGCVGAILPNGYSLKDDDVIDWVIVDEQIDDFDLSRQIILNKAFFNKVDRTPIRPDPRPYDSDDAVFQIMFSSGTTGQPKAVPFTISRAEKRSLGSRVWRIGEPFFCLLGMSSSLSFVVYFSQIAHGETYVVPAEGKDLLNQIERWKIGALIGSPHQLFSLARLASHDPRPFDSLTTIGSIGATLPDSVGAVLQEQFSAHVVSLYGSSEGGIIARRDGLGSAQGLAGRILDGIDIRIVDESGTELDEGEVGLIGVKRTDQPGSYVNDDQASNAAFRDGYFYAGDVGYVRGSDLYLAGRQDELINAAGTKVDPEKIDGIAMGFPHIDDVGAFGAVTEEGLDVVGLAFVASQELNVDTFVGFMNQKLGNSAPRTYLRLEKIPRTQDTGKVIREKLTAIFETQDPRAGREFKPVRPKYIPPKL